MSRFSRNLGKMTAPLCDSIQIMECVTPWDSTNTCSYKQEVVETFLFQWTLRNGCASKCLPNLQSLKTAWIQDSWGWSINSFCSAHITMFLPFSWQQRNFDAMCFLLYWMQNIRERAKYWSKHFFHPHFLLGWKIFCWQLRASLGFCFFWVGSIQRLQLKPIGQ